ncbi:cell wall-active antibiotics response protein [candidate division KSB1 bacterium]|nr:cell wall-active antibiotics response protein [candidate division KSB1 bacterium]RQW05713.1 MAG: hypothetical protein EH222_09630 [candidate division KSB1 bacterium]
MAMYRSNRNALYLGGALIALGVLFLLNNARIIRFDFIFAHFWPLLLIAIGVLVIYKSYHRGRSPVVHSTLGDRSAYTADDAVDVSHTFGDLRVFPDSQAFKGGKLQTTFGELHVDLSRIKLSKGKNVLNLNVTFGEIVVVLSRELPVRVTASNVGGDIRIFEQKWDGLNQRAVWQSKVYDGAASALDIVCTIVFGDIKVW